ncbi:hypothetical protein [Sphingomonas sp. GB1N7]|uniref:hypothetical protein n=1 Tax=Parasphingomonas caseinilytica TaxID=3096158 RepID=UPI002FC59762
MMRAAALLLLPAAVLAGVGTAIVHRNGKSAMIASISSAAGLPVEAADVVHPTVVGMNVGGLDYFTGEWAFNDIVQTAATVYFSDPKGGWKEADGLFQFDQSGHPIHIPKDTILPVALQGATVRLQGGTYACNIADGWDVRPFQGLVIKGTGKRFSIVVGQPAPAAGITFFLTATRNNAALNSFSCIRQGDDSSTPFNPTFLAEKRPYKVLRFMDWMRTNNAPKRIWADRTTPASFTQGGKGGVALEYMVALANITGSDPWFTMPLDTDPGYYEKFATYVREHLDPKLKVYVEYSNEVWNDALQQSKTATQRGRELYPDVDPTMANDFYYADRVREVMGIWTKVFAGQQSRLVRILANQAVWAERADRALAHKDTWKSVDALAIAPYFTTDPYTLAGTGATRVNALFARSPEIVNQAIGNALEAKKVARKFSLQMVAYEAGPSFVGYQKEIGEDMLAANRDPRIYDMYTTYLKRWQKQVGGLLVLFDAVSTPGPGGQFGHREYTGQPLSEAPKARAVGDFMAQLKQ